MGSLLLKNAEIVITMDAQRREIARGWVLVEGGAIAALGDGAPPEADQVIDLTGQVLLPGLINTHHHMYQTLTRALPAAQDAELFDWLGALYPVWARMTPEDLRTATLSAMAELMLSGCTTAADHLYIFPNGCTLDDTIAAAREIGIRFHPTRGAMSLGQSKGGLPPDSVVEDEAAILVDMQRVFSGFHDASPHSMLRIGIAPCSPFSVTRELMRDAAIFARQHGLRLHTHLAENEKDIAFTRERFRCTPAEYAEELGWLGEDVWHAHCVHLDAAGIAAFARSGTGVAHCPCSNMRLASGIAPIPAMRAAGVPVGLGVDGSASNDGGHMLGEARQAMLLARVGHGPAAMTARQALELATLGGARVLGRQGEIGALVPGMAADLVAFDVHGLDQAGAADLVAALVFCTPPRAALSVINGRVVVRDERLLTLDERTQAARHRAASARLLT